MQSHTIHESALDRLLEIEQREKLAKVHHQHLGNGQVRVRQFYTGQHAADMHARMDAESKLISEAGGQFESRTKIGRNSTCPCGSGLKFKKCCIGKAAMVGPATQP